MSGAEFLSWFGETSLAISVLIIAILLVRRPVARRFGPEAAYLLWIAPLARLATPELSILPASWREKTQAAPIEWTLAAAPDDALIAASPAPAMIEPSTALFVLWLAGAIAFLVAQFQAQRQFMTTLLDGATEPSPEIAAEAAVIAERSGLKRPLRIIIAHDASGPLVAGAFRPVIVLPANFDSAYSSAERQLALSHEVAHIARGDLLTTFAALAFRALEWPNPLAHIAFRAFRADQEAACDASVLARNAAIPDVSYAYGAAIVKSAARRLSAPAASLAMSNHIKERLMLIKNGKMQSAAIGRALAAALIIAGVGASASYSYAAEKDAKKDKEVVKTEKKTSVQVIRVDDDEKLKIDGVEGAKKIEVRNENGKRTVKVWDKDGKLISENVYGPDEKMPYETIVVIDGEGKAQTIDIAQSPMPPEAFAWVSGQDEDPLAWAFDEGDDGDHKEHRKVVVIKNAGDHPVDLRCDAISIGANEVDPGDKRITCVGYRNEKDPAARAAALKKAIAHMEESAKKEAEHREKVLARLRADLAEAEKEAKKK